MVAKIYRVFPLDSSSARTPNVPTRVNSPSETAFASRDSGAGGVTFSSTTVAVTFTALGGIHQFPKQTTLGKGPISGAGTTPFSPGVTDLQTWTRDANLDPDWLRVGTDIIGGATPATFNAAFHWMELLRYLSRLPAPQYWEE